MRIPAIAMATGIAMVGSTLAAASLPTLVATSASGATMRASGATAHRVATSPYDPSRLTHLGNARQVVVVTASSWSTSYATVRTYSLDSSGWRQQFAPMSARIGSRGFAQFGKRKQDSGETPAGTYALMRAFGSATDPGTALPYRQFDRNDWWPYDPRDPRTYNVAQFRGRDEATLWRPSWAEHLWHFHDQYAYAVVLDYNLPAGVYRSGSQRFATATADTRAGGGIFLHVKTTRPTAGCVAVSRSGMQSIVRWLDPGQDPVIVMAPTSAIGRA